MYFAHLYFVKVNDGLTGNTLERIGMVYGNDLRIFNEEHVFACGFNHISIVVNKERLIEALLVRLAFSQN